MRKKNFLCLKSEDGSVSDLFLGKFNFILAHFFFAQDSHRPSVVKKITDSNHKVPIYKKSLPTPKIHPYKP